MNDDADLIHELFEEFCHDLDRRRNPDISEFLNRLPLHCQVYRTNLLLNLLTAKTSYLIKITNGSIPTRAEVLRMEPKLASEISSTIFDIVRKESEDAPFALDQYYIEETVSKGAEGWIAKAISPNRSRPVALKIYHESTGHTSLQREKAALMRLDHPLIVKLIGSGKALEYRYLVLEYCDFPRLSQTFSEVAASVHDIYRVTEQLCSAIQHCHEQGVFHGDIKPENLLVSKAGEFRLVDFGLCSFGGDYVQPATYAPAYSGTFLYMPREKAERLANVDLKSADLFGIGTVLYWLFARHSPYQMHPSRVPSNEESRQLAINAQINEKSLESAQQRYPKLVQICRHLLSVSPTDRPPTVEHVLQELERTKQDYLSSFLPIRLGQTEGAAEQISEAAEVRFRKARLESLKVRFRVDDQLWDQIYRPIDEERRLLQRCVPATPHISKGMPLVKMNEGRAILYAPIDCLFSAHEQMEKHSVVVVTVAASSIPDDIHHLAESPQKCSRAEFLEALRFWTDSLERAAGTHLYELSMRHQESLAKYDTQRIRRRRKLIRQRFITKHFKKLRLLLTAFATVFIYFWLFYQLTVMGTFNGTEQESDQMLREMASPVFGVTGLLALFFYATFAELFIRILLDMLKILPPYDHPFHTNENSSEFRIGRYFRSHFKVPGRKDGSYLD